MVPGCRTYREDECRECEASNMCTDFWEMGLTDMIVDSGVRVAYEPSIAKWLYDMDRVRAALPMQMPNVLPFSPTAGTLSAPVQRAASGFRSVQNLARDCRRAAPSLDSL